MRVQRYRDVMTRVGIFYHVTCLAWGACRRFLQALVSRFRHLNNKQFFVWMHLQSKHSGPWMAWLFSSRRNTRRVELGQSFTVLKAVSEYL